MSSSSNRDTSIAVDMLSMLPGWLLLLLIDPWTATVHGIPIGAVLIALRHIWWSERPVSGRVVSAVAMPIIGLFSATFVAFGSTGPLLGMLLAASILALAEGWNRRFGRTFVCDYPILVGAFFLALSVIFSALLLESWVTRYPTEEFLKSVSQAPDAPDWSIRAKKQAVITVHGMIKEGSIESEDVEELQKKVAFKMGALVSAKSPNGIFVTLYGRGGYSVRGFSKYGDNSLERVMLATADALQDDPTRPRSTKTKSRNWKKAGARVQIDVAGPPRSITYRPFFHIFSEQFRGAHRSLKKLNPLGTLFNLSFEIEPGVDGIEVRKDGGKDRAFMLPADPVTYGWATPRVRSAPEKIRNMLSRTWRKKFDEKLPLETDDFAVRKFRTTSFTELRKGGKIVNLFRGNVLLEGDLNRKTLVARTILAADWLSRQVKVRNRHSDSDEDDREIGRFHYEIYPPYKRGTKDYNLPRHAGSIYGLFAISKAVSLEPAFAKAGRRALDAGLTALDYVKGRLGSPDPKAAPNSLCFVDKKGKITSGATALAAMAIAELPDVEDVRDQELKERVKTVPMDKWLKGMGACMMQMIDPDGAVFRTYKQSRASKRVKKEPLYFPGEVMLALVRIHKRIGDEQFLEGAKRIGDRQQRIYRWPLLFDWPYPGDHWIIQAQYELSQVTGDRKYAELSVLMGRGYMREQHPPQDYLYPDYRGAYRRIADLPRTTRAASRGEALGSAMEAARFLGEDASDFETALIEGARHLLEQQFVRENSYFVPNKFDIIGGIRMGLLDNHLRIDNNQHALVALLSALKAMEYQTAY
ncbi:MAG: hypothetical protein GY847_26545 [Proteobacteria bacterium]|nr:hypothetical protein [Pseudomonadota bacterium]